MDAVSEIKARLNVEEVIGDYLQLKSAGKNLKALSPFTAEKTPSFMISPEKQIWYCFSTNQGGDMFDFVMKMDGLDFRGALELLARKAGIDLAQYGSKGAGDGKRKQRLLDMLELSTKYFQASLAKNQNSIDYIKSREFNRETVVAFGFGYAPKSDTGLVSFLRKNGFKDEEIAAGGIASDRNGLKDLFRARITLPLRDSSGKTVGFVGRKLVDDEYGPKYLNSPQTILYDKSRFIFGLNIAKNAIREHDEVVLVEGNLDVVMSYQAGVKQVVAASGTALSEYQLKQLKRFTQNIKLAFDEDEAGVRATERAIELAQPLGINLSIVSIPSGKDPDELIKQDASLWQQAIDEAPYVIDWLFATLERTYDVQSAEGKKKFSDRALKTIARLSDPVEQEHYMQKLSDSIGSSVQALQAKLDSMGSRPKTRQDRKAKVEVEPKQLTEIDRVEEAVLSLALIDSDVRSHLDKLDKEHFSSEDRRTISAALKQIDTSISEKQLPENLQLVESYVKILLLKGEETYSSWNSSDRSIEAMSLIKRMRALHKSKTKQSLSEQIRAAESAGDKKQAQELLKKYQSLVNE